MRHFGCVHFLCDLECENVKFFTRAVYQCSTTTWFGTSTIEGEFASQSQVARGAAEHARDGGFETAKRRDLDEVAGRFVRITHTVPNTYTPKDRFGNVRPDGRRGGGGRRSRRRRHCQQSLASGIQRCVHRTVRRRCFQHVLRQRRPVLRRGAVQRAAGVPRRRPLRGQDAAAAPGAWRRRRRRRPDALLAARVGGVGAVGVPVLT